MIDSPQLRECKECGVDKPIDQFRYRERGRSRTCRLCENAKHADWAAKQRWLNARRTDGDYSLPLPQRDLDTEEFRPATVKPLTMPWEMTCQMCGRGKDFQWTPEEARAVSLHLLAHRVRCQWCKGWLMLQPGMLSVRDRVQREEDAA